MVRSEGERADGFLAVEPETNQIDVDRNSPYSSSAACTTSLGLWKPWVTA